MAETTAYFLHYASEEISEGGVYLPFASAQEAERQAAWELDHGADPDSFERIFAAPYDPPRKAWSRAQLRAGEVEMPHLVEKHRKRHATAKQIHDRASKHLHEMEVERVDAIAEQVIEMEKKRREGTLFQNSASGRTGYSVMTGGTATAGAAAMVAATAKTLCMVTTGATTPPSVVEIGISFDGVTASAVPVLVELVSGTAASTGTVVAQTPKQLRGWPSSASVSSGQITITAEPTTQLVNRKWLVRPDGGLFVIQFPLGREPTGLITATTDGKTWSVRATAPAIVNVHAYLEFEE